MDGVILPAESARLPALSRAVLYGEGLFETLRTYGGRPFAWDRHLERLRGSAAELRIPLPPGLDGVQRAIPDLLRRNGLSDGVVRLTLLAGEGGGGFAGVASTSHLLLSVREIPAALVEERRLGVQAVTKEVGSVPLAAHKSTSYLRSVLASRGSVGAVREVLFLDDGARMLEGAASNVFVLAGGRLLTPPADGRILPGVTRALVLDVARGTGLETRETALGTGVVRDAEALFLTSSVIELLSVVALDGRVVGGGAPHVLVTELHRAYRDRVRRETGWSEELTAQPGDQYT